MLPPLPPVSHSNVSVTRPLFGLDAPPGFRYRAELIDAAEEDALVQHIRHVQFSTFEMRGVIARRRVAFFGHSYDARGTVSLPIPEFLLPVRARLADWVGISADAFAMALINEYREGAPIGWHRDAPQYEWVAGLSLLASCTMKLRPYLPPAAAPGRGVRRGATHEVLLERRSAYLLSGEARTAFEHHIPPARELRYSVTFRTLRKSASL